MKLLQKSLILSTVTVLHIYALNINEVMLDTIQTNPNILAKQSEYKSAYEDVKIANGDNFLPSIDLRGDIGKSRTTYKKPINNTKTDTSKNLNITLTENLFDGFGTKYNIRAQKAFLAASAYTYIEVANEQALQSAIAYIDVIRNRELLNIEQESLNQHEDIQKNIRIRSSSGVGVISDLQEIQSKTNLAHSNYLAQKKNFKSSQIVLHKVLGRYLDPMILEEPSININLPETLESATNFALSHHPALKIQSYNVDKAHNSYKRDQKDLYYPTIDLVIAQSLHDGRNTDTATKSQYNQTNGQIQFNWNLFRGLKDQATKQKNISALQSEAQRRNAIKRDVIEEVQLAYTQSKILEKEYHFLQAFEVESEKKLNTFHKEFRVGKRGLLELLAAQSDFNMAKHKLINTKLDLVVSKITLLKALGILSDTVSPNILKSVGIDRNGSFDYSSHLNKDIEAINIDSDGDNVLKDDDFCDNSKNAGSQFGCEYRFSLNETPIAEPTAVIHQIVEEPVQTIIESAPIQEYVEPKPILRQSTTPLKKGVKYHTFKLKTNSYIYDAPSGQKVNSLTRGSKLTGYYDGHGWIRISGLITNSWNKYNHVGYISTKSVKKLSIKKPKNIVALKSDNGLCTIYKKR
jgi:adhesin transport system outer membrane protein